MPHASENSWRFSLDKVLTTLVENLPPVSTTPVANLPLASTTPVADFATGTNKFATGVYDTGGAPGVVNKFFNKHQTAQIDYSEA